MLKCNTLNGSVQTRHVTCKNRVLYFSIAVMFTFVYDTHSRFCAIKLAGYFNQSECLNFKLNLFMGPSPTSPSEHFFVVHKL